jgi:hypothetical protein
MTENELSKEIIGAAIEVHKILGPGLLEDVYEEALCYELSLRNIPTQRQMELPIVYKGRQLQKKYALSERRPPPRRQQTPGITRLFPLRNFASLRLCVKQRT